MSWTPCSAQGSAQSRMAVSWGTPTPATTRVVQMAAGPMPTLTASSAGLDQCAGAAGGGDVAGDNFDVQVVLDTADHIQDGGVVAVGGVDDEGIDAGVGEFAGAVEGLTLDADGGGDDETALVVVDGVGELLALGDVFDGDEAAEDALVVDDGQLFDAVFVEAVLGLLEGGADGGGDEAFAGHEVGDGAGLVVGEAHVAVGEDADEASVLIGNGDAGDAVAGHDGVGFGESGGGREGDWIDDHAGLGALDLVDFADLVVGGEVAVNDADAAGAGHGDGHGGLGDGVHGGGHEGYVESEVGRDAGAGGDLGGQDVGPAGDKKHVVVGKAFDDAAGGRDGLLDEANGIWIKRHASASLRHGLSRAHKKDPAPLGPGSLRGRAARSRGRVPETPAGDVDHLSSSCGYGTRSDGCQRHRTSTLILMKP